METLMSPTVRFEQLRRYGRNRQVYYRFYPAGSAELLQLSDAVGGVWFRVVLDHRGRLHTAFRDHYTEIQGETSECPTPETRTTSSREYPSCKLRYQA